MAYNKWINTFSTQAEYEEYIAGSVDQYPNIAYVEATDSVYVLEEEHIPVFSIKVLDGLGDEYSDGATIDGDGETLDFLYVEGYLDGEQISTDDFSVTANNGLVFTDETTRYQAELPYGYDSTYNYTITATCSGQTVTFSLTYVQASTPSIDYSISVMDVEEGGELVPMEGYWVELSSEQETPQEPFDGDFVVECSGEGFFTYNFDRDNDGGVDGTLTFDGAEDGDTITISYVQNGVTLASASYVASVSSGGDYRLVLSKCPDPSEGDWCITQGFCDDSDYYVLLMDGDTLALYDGQTVEYELFGETYHPQLVDPGAGTCVWLCSAFDPSITEVNCYDDGGNLIATLNTSCL